MSVLAGAAEDFPPSLWDRLLPQKEITLNLLRQSNATPMVSACVHLCGPFDYNKMPLAPMGCTVQVHEKTVIRGTWAYHSVDGWYLSTSPDHYRTHRCHIKATKSEWVSDTINFSHKHITRPTTISSEGARKRTSPTTDTVDSTVTQTCQTTNRTSTFETNGKTHKHTSNAKH